MYTLTVTPTGPATARPARISGAEVVSVSEIEETPHYAGANFFESTLIGTLIYTAINTRNYPVVQAGVLVVVFLFVLTNLLVDLSYSWLDPRVR